MIRTRLPTQGGKERPARYEDQDQRASGPEGGSCVMGLRGKVQ
jgi:hypothetical protein